MINPDGAREALDKSMSSQFSKYGGSDATLNKMIDDMQNNVRVKYKTL